MREEPNEGGHPVGHLFDVTAEQDLIGAILLHHNAEVPVVDLDPDDFHSPKTRAAFQAIGDLFLKDGEITQISVADRALHYDPEFKRHVLMDWMATEVYVGSMARMTERVLQLSRRRRAYQILAAGMTDLADESSDALVVSTDLSDRLLAVSDGAGLLNEINMAPAYEIAERSEEDMPWLIPGIMYRQDATMIVAGEGAGKSYLGRMVCLAAEAGLQPFTRSTEGISPIRTLSVDLENKRRAVSESVKAISAAIRFQQPAFIARGPIWEEPSGIDLLTARDRRRFVMALKETKPDLVFLGPMYKTYRLPRDMKEDAAIAEITAFLDDCRRRFDIGLWMENHAPHGSHGQRSLRPIGTSLWLRWPEYGKGFKQDPDNPKALLVESWRGDRTKVYWPKRLIRSQQMGGSQMTWPFTGDYGKRLDLKIHGRPMDRTPAPQLDLDGV